MAMETPSSLVPTKEDDGFTYLKGHQGATTSEVEKLLPKGKKTELSSENELEARKRIAKFREPTAVVDCIDLLENLIDYINLLKGLEGQPANMVTLAVKILKREPIDNKNLKYQTFLRNLYCPCGRGMVALCAAGLGKKRITNLKSRERLRLVEYLKVNKAAFLSPILDEVAERHLIPHEHELFIPDSGASKSSGGKRSISGGKRSISDGKRPISDGKRSISDGKRPVSDVLGDHRLEKDLLRRKRRKEKRAMKKKVGVMDERAHPDAQKAMNDGSAFPKEPEDALA